MVVRRDEPGSDRLSRIIGLIAEEEAHGDSGSSTAILERLVEAETLSRTMSRTVEQLGRTVQGLSEVLARLDGRIGRGGE